MTKIINVMGRIIINNRTKLPDHEAMLMVYKVMEKGRVSNDGKQYCYLSAFMSGTPYDYHVVTDLRKCSDSFIIYQSSQSNTP